MAEQVGKFLTELPELETPTDGDLMYIVDDETTSKKVTMANLKRVLGGNVTGTVEDVSVSFSDGADGIPMEECEVTLVPTQDLHGYSKPWAGGAGKNKLNVNINDYTTSGVTITNSDGVITLENTATANVTINLRTDRINISDIGNTYKLVDDGSFTFSSDIYLNIRYYDSNGSAISNQSMTSGKSMNLSVPSNAYSFMPMIIVKSGIATNGTVKPMLMLQTETDETFAPYSNICPISGHTDVTVTVASTSGGSGEDTTVSLGRTVYGGTLDVATGVLTVTHGRVDLGSLSWSLVGSGNSERFQTNGLTDNLLPPNNSTPFSGLCEIYEVERWDYLESAGHDIFICNNFTSHWLAVRDTNYTSATDFTNSVNGKYLVYELATPQSYNLTPTQVLTLLGQNYVSHDGGGNIKVVYIRDLDITINDLIDRVTALENE